MRVFPWREIEIELTSEVVYANVYTDVDVWVEFTHTTGTTLRRPAFWDGGNRWGVRFASPVAEGVWTWRSFSSVQDAGLAGRSGGLECEAGSDARNRFYRHGFWQLSPGRRSLVHADGTPALLVGDTAWGLPWRATEEQCKVYALDRHRKGFNAVLLMSVQPDMHARGPRDRMLDEGFGVGFDDLQEGHLNRLEPSYFQHLDRLLGILVDHEIVPVLQPVFQGFGWKGLEVAGTVVPPAEYARYCRYLVARYGARPAVYLVGADGSGREPQIQAGGEEVERWDAYRQPTGIHYRPHADNRAHQEASWLDFQWCQTGHGGEHVPERVADMWQNRPAKGVANGEPTYEHGGLQGRAEGWWQGHEAWCNLCAGGTFGVVYGAGSLWQWRLHPDEPGHAEFFLAEGAGWREALDFEGSSYVGLISKILEGLPLTDIAPHWQVALAPRELFIPGELFICYKEKGGGLQILNGDGVPRHYFVIDPKTGQTLQRGTLESNRESIPDESREPRVYIFYDGEVKE